jgi:hypothetical protein
MPDRIIRESATLSESLAKLSHLAERIFWRLTTVADDHGRFSGNLAIVRGRCLPLVQGISDQDLNAALLELQAVGAIQLYEVEGKRYLAFKSWKKHQRTYEGKPKFPEPPRVAATCETSQQLPGNRGESRESPALNENENENRNVNGCAEKSRRKRVAIVNPDFEKAWAIYPDRKPTNPKSKALSSWNGAIARGHTADAMTAAVARYAAYVRAEGNEGTKYVKYGATFFASDDDLKAGWAISQAALAKATSNGKPTRELPTAAEYFERQA